MLYVIPDWNTIYEFSIRQDGKIEVFIYDMRNWGCQEPFGVYNSFTHFENDKPPSIGYYYDPQWTPKS